MEAIPTIEPRYDAVVIGAGMGGLAAAGWLARAGLKVGVFEKHSKPGGYGQYFGKEPTFDSATHLISGSAPGGWLHSALAAPGILERIELLPLNPSYRARFGAEEMLIPPDPEALRQELSARFPAEASGLERFFADVATMGQDYLALAEGAAGDGLLQKNSFRTAWHFLSDYTREPQLAALLSSLWPLAGLPPSQLSALQFAALWHTYHQQGGACAVRGGMARLGHALVDAVTECGGIVAFRTLVRRVLRSGRRATGVELEDGTRVECGALVANGNPQDLFEELLGDGDRAPARYPALDDTTSSSAMEVFLQVDLDLDLPARTTVFQRSWDSAAAWLDLQREEPEFSSLLITELTHGDRERAPEGRRMLVLMAPQPYSRSDGWNVPIENRRDKSYRVLPDYIALKERLGDRLVEAAEAVIPGLREHTVFRKVATPITMERYTFNTGGAAFGWANIPPQCGGMRPGAASPVERLYLAGHWTFPGSGISAALQSGRLAAEAILSSRAGR